MTEFAILTTMKLTYEDSLKLVRAAHRAYGGDTDGPRPQGDDVTPPEVQKLAKYRPEGDCR